MATVAEALAAIQAAVTANAAAERTEVLAVLQALLAELQALKDIIAAGGSVTQEQLDAAVAGVAEGIAGIITPADTPPA